MKTRMTKGSISISNFKVFGREALLKTSVTSSCKGLHSTWFPIGLGFWANQVGHRGLFLDAGFETGHYSTAAATFGRRGCWRRHETIP